MENTKPNNFNKSNRSTNTPNKTDWIPLGENYGIGIAIWDNGVTLTKRNKQNDKWIDIEKFNLSKTVVERIFIKIPYWYGKLVDE